MTRSLAYNFFFPYFVFLFLILNIDIEGIFFFTLVRNYFPDVFAHFIFYGYLARERDTCGNIVVSRKKHLTLLLSRARFIILQTSPQRI